MPGRLRADASPHVGDRRRRPAGAAGGGRGSLFVAVVVGRGRRLAGRTSTTTPSSRARPSRCSSSSPCRRPRATRCTHPVLLTDVEIGRVTALSYLFYKLQGDTDLDPVDVGHRRDAAVAARRPGQPRDVPGRGGRQDGGPPATRLHGPATAAGAVVFGTFAGHPGLPGPQRG